MRRDVLERARSDVMALYPHPPGHSFATAPPLSETIATETSEVALYSTGEEVIVAVPGTGVGPGQTTAELWTLVRQWLRNLDYRQVETSAGYRVHRGWWYELDRAYKDVLSCLRDYGASERNLVITGHSAGAALAILLARRLEDDGHPAQAVYAFSAPRVGDAAFRDGLGTPIYRFECRDDPVPHFPFSPGIASLVDWIVGRCGASVDALCPGLGVGQWLADFRETEYYHAGNIYFLDWDGDWCTQTRGLGGYLQGLIDALDHGTNTVVMPTSALGPERLRRTLAAINDGLETEDLRFVLDHCLRRAWGESWKSLFAA